MSLPRIVRSKVDCAAVTKVTRLFNNTIGDVLSELIQNARRAGATAVVLSLSSDGKQLSVLDDGCGIADPSVVLSLGRSSWQDDVVRREDPAGMGVFSLAGQHILIRSRSMLSDSGWQVEIAGHAWEDGSPIAVVACDRPVGTEIIVTLDERWSQELVAAARGAARYCPIPIFLNDEPLKREDWLAGACAVFEQDGVRIGVFDDRRANSHSCSINFHGVTVGGGFAPKVPRITPATPEQGQAIAIAVERMREARTLRRRAGARQAAAAVGKAISSAEGAACHVQHRIRRTFR